MRPKPQLKPQICRGNNNSYLEHVDVKSIPSPGTPSSLLLHYEIMLANAIEVTLDRA